MSIKKQLYLVFILNMIFFLCIVGSRKVHAENVIYQLGGHVTGELSSDGTLTVSGTGAMHDYEPGASPLYENRTVRSVIVKDGVSYIGSNAFEKCYTISHVDVAGSVKSIGRNAFVWDSGIREVILREGIERLEFFCFGRCAGIETVQFATSIREIEAGVFYGCFNLRDVILPENLETIGGDAFGGCVCIETLEIPASVRKLEMPLFSACHNIMGEREYSLQNIYVSPENQSYKDIDGVVYTKDGREIIWYPQGRKDTVYTVESGIETVGRDALRNDYLETIQLPDSVTVISDYAFAGDVNLKSINLPDRLTEIGSCVFEACWMIDNVVVPRSVTYLGYLAFAKCLNLHNITIMNENIRIAQASINGGSISDYIFSDCPDDLMVHTSKGSSIDRYMSQYVTGNRVYDLQRMGDIDNDGNVDAKDKKTIYNHIAGTAKLTGNQYTAGDMDGNGVIDAKDKKLLYNYILSHRTN